MDNTIYITDENGKEIKMNILFTFDYDDDRYVIVYEDGKDDDLYPFKYDEDGHLFAVEDEEELSIFNEVLSAFEGDDEE